LNIKRIIRMGRKGKCKDQGNRKEIKIRVEKVQVTQEMVQITDLQMEDPNLEMEGAITEP
jgi:hypothetical protein